MKMNTKGFTIVELMVGIAVSSILLIGAVGFYVTYLQQAPVTKERTRLGVDLRKAMDMISDDIRRSTGASTYNLAPDVNAPTTLAGYEDVPGPTPVDADDNYYWRIGSDRLILRQTPIDSDGSPLYDDAVVASGKKNSIIYYTKDGALYRREVAADYTNNSLSTVTCSPLVPAGGCQDRDMKLVDALDLSADSPFSIKYFSKSGAEVELDGATPDYGSINQARSVQVSISLKSTTGSGQDIKVNDSALMHFRAVTSAVSGDGGTPPSTPGDPEVPYVPLPSVDGFGLMAGPGGLTIQYGRIAPGKMYVDGKVHLRYYSSIGSMNWTPNVSAWINNRACGSGSSYPSYCGAGSAPVTEVRGGAWYFYSNANTCPRDWVVGMPGIGGMHQNCTPPARQLPPIDKAEHVAAMTRGQHASPECDQSVVLPKGRTITENVTLSGVCSGAVDGTVYLKKDLTLATGSVLRVDDSAGVLRPVILVNGRVDIQSGARIEGNVHGATPIIVSFDSTDATCSNSDTCIAISGAKLQETINSSDYAIRVANATIAGTLYAYFGTVSVGANGQVGSIAGQQIRLVGSNSSATGTARVSMTSYVY